MKTTRASPCAAGQITRQNHPRLLLRQPAVAVAPPRHLAKPAGCQRGSQRRAAVRAATHLTPRCLRGARHPPSFCRHWRRGHRGPTPNSHTHAMDTVSAWLLTRPLALRRAGLCDARAAGAAAAGNRTASRPGPLTGRSANHTLCFACCACLQPSTTCPPMDTVSGARRQSRAPPGLPAAQSTALAGAGAALPLLLPSPAAHD